MARSLLRQLEQIRRSATYDDAVASINTSPVAEPTVSGSLEGDMNVVRSLMKQVKGSTNWYDDPGTYFDPTNTDSGNATNLQMDLSNIKGNTLDAKTVLIAVTEDNSGSGHATASGTAGILTTNVSTSYATDADRRGLPVYASTGDYHDEGGDMRVCRVDVLDMDNDQEFEDGSGNTVFALMEDGNDNGGAGSGTDVYFNFYVNESSPTPYTFTGSDPTSVKFVFPHRKVMNNVEEWEWLRTDFISSWEGDVELVDDISNLWSFTGAADDLTSPTWTNITANYPLSGNPSDLEAAINALNDVIDDMTFTEDNYISDGDTVADAIDSLDQALKDVEESVAAGVADKYVESVSSGFSAETVHSLPYSITYTPDSSAGQEGSNMDVYVDGQLLAADPSAGDNRDYDETTASGITFHFDIQTGRNITYLVRQ